MAKYGRNFLKQQFFETLAFSDCFFVTDGRIDVGVSANERPWRMDVPFDTLGQIRPPYIVRNWPNAQSCDFPKHVHIGDSQYPFESGRGWGLFVFHKYFLVKVDSI